jgi:hypothetical protein
MDLAMNLVYLTLIKHSLVFLRCSTKNNPLNDLNVPFSNIIILIVSPLIAYRRIARRSLPLLKNLSQSTSDAGITRMSHTQP